MCFSLFIATSPAQNRGDKSRARGNAGKPKESRPEDLNKSFEEFVRLTEEYRKSIEQLISLYNKDVQRAEERLAKLRELYAQKLIGKGEVDSGERAVVEARAKIEEAQKQLQQADAQVAALYKSSISTLQVMYDQKPFNVSVQKLPVNYYGIDERPLRAALAKRKEAEKKDEFETTELDCTLE